MFMASMEGRAMYGVTWSPKGFPRSLHGICILDTESCSSANHTLSSIKHSQ